MSVKISNDYINYRLEFMIIIYSHYYYEYIDVKIITSSTDKKMLITTNINITLYRSYN